MSRLQEYKVPFIGLKVGIHEYEFELDSKFFEEFEYSEMDNGEVNVHLALERKENMMVLDFDLRGVIETLCDRCGTNVQIPIESQQQLVVKFGEETGTTDDEILEIGPSVYELDLFQYLYEYIILALPARRTHESDEDCDQDAIDRLEQFNDEEEKTDPRWDALKNIK